MKINTLLTEDMTLIENSKVNGFMKLWLYQFYCLAHLSWPFMINDLTRSFALELQAEINLKLKKWAGAKYLSKKPQFALNNYFQKLKLLNSGFTVRTISMDLNKYQ